jgi:folate-binding protein YgfZ
MVSGYQEARNGAAFDERLDRGRVLLTGADGRGFLHALLTNDIASLAPGTGCYAALLTPQGRMITDLDVLAFEAQQGQAHLLVVPSDVAGPLAARLDKSIFTEQVEVWDMSGTTSHFSIVGPKAGVAADAVAGALGHGGVTSGLAKPYDSAALQLAENKGALIWRSDDIGLDAFDIVVPSEFSDVTRGTLAAHAAPLSGEARETLRVEAGRPKFHIDMTEETIPLEANLLERAISTTKGCYVGQEVIIRVLHRGGGRVAKRLVRLRFEAGTDAQAPGSAPAAGTVLVDGEREVGRVTSAVWSPRDEAAIGLGYVHRDFAREGVMLALSSGGSAAITAA